MQNYQILCYDIITKYVTEQFYKHKILNMIVTTFVLPHHLTLYNKRCRRKTAQCAQYNLIWPASNYYKNLQ